MQIIIKNSATPPPEIPPTVPLDNP